MITPELLDYIKKQTAIGSSKEVITKTLLASGWKELDVNEAFAKIAAPTATPAGTPAPEQTQPEEPEPQEPQSVEIKKETESPVAEVQQPQTATPGRGSGTLQENLALKRTPEQTSSSDAPGMPGTAMPSPAQNTGATIDASFGKNVVGSSVAPREGGGSGRGWIFVLIAIVVLAGVGYYLWSAGILDPLIEKIKPMEEVVVEPEPEPEPEPEFNLLAFVGPFVEHYDETNDISFEYPERFALATNEDGSITITSIPIPEVDEEVCNALEDEQARANCLNPVSSLSPNISLRVLEGDSQQLWDENVNIIPDTGLAETALIDGNTWQTYHYGGEFGGTKTYGLATETSLVLASFYHEDTSGGYQFEGLESSAYLLDAGQQQELLEEILKTFQFGPPEVSTPIEE